MTMRVKADDLIRSLPKQLERNNRMSLSELYVDETIFSLANGILGIRGHFAEGYGGDHSYHMTFINGFFNRYPYAYEENSLQFPQLGQVLVNVMDATTMTISLNGEHVNLTDATLISLKRTFDMAQGMTRRKAVYQMPSGVTVIISEERLVSKVHLGLAVSRLSIETTDYEGPITFESELQLPKVKSITANDPRLAQGRHHLEYVSHDIIRGMAMMTARTTHTAMDVTVAIKHDLTFTHEKRTRSVVQRREDHLSPAHPIIITTKMMYETSSGIFNETIDDLNRQILSFDELLAQQQSYQTRFFKDLPAYVDDPKIMTALLYHMIQLDQSGGVSDHLQIAAKGISGEGYEGHYFWDTEIYMIPYFILTNPCKAKTLLTYRFRHLEQAKEEAKRLGVNQGVKIPWRTIDGSEASPYFPAGSAQIHINSDVAFATMQYLNATQDWAFLEEAGFELLVETARFILGYGHFMGEAFHINGVTGPDEYTVLVNDNYYTNRMAKAHFEWVVMLYDRHRQDLDQVINRLGLSDDEVKTMAKAAKEMTLLIDPSRMIALQDSTFDTLPELDLNQIPRHHHPMLLFYHPMMIYRHQILKQADAVLAMTLLGENDQTLYRNSTHHYLLRTTHDSSLSKCMYGIASYHIGDHERAYDYWTESLRLDLDNLRNHTQHGLHVANLGGTYLTLIYGLFGLKMTEILTLKPVFQTSIKTFAATIMYQGSRLFISVTNNHFRLETDHQIDVMINGTRHRIQTVYEEDLNAL